MRVVSEATRSIPEVIDVTCGDPVCEAFLDQTTAYGGMNVRVLKSRVRRHVAKTGHEVIVEASSHTMSRVTRRP